GSSDEVSAARFYRIRNGRLRDPHHRLPRDRAHGRVDRRPSRRRKAALVRPFGGTSRLLTKSLRAGVRTLSRYFGRGQGEGLLVLMKPSLRVHAPRRPHNPPLERTVAAVYFTWSSVARAPPRPLNGITLCGTEHHRATSV